MENAAEALKIAAGFLIFVLALSISINAFGEVRVTSQTILDYKDREYDYTYVEDNGTTERMVGLETIIPSIYKAYKENYKIVFDINAIKANGVYQRINPDSTTTKVNEIDLRKEVLGSDTEKEEFIRAILYGSKDGANFLATKAKFKKDKKILLNDTGIYGIISSGQRFRERLGVYYQEDVPAESGGDVSDTPDVNKTKKRVITYEDR